MNTESEQPTNMQDPKDALLKEIERVAGRKIMNASDCQSLSIDIFKKTQRKLSLNTLRRFFNLMKSEYKPSLFTLDILTEYCGYSNFSDFTNREQHGFALVAGEASSIVDFLLFLFKDTEIRKLHDSSYLMLVSAVITNLEQWPTLIDTLQARIAKTVNGQVFYFEQFVNTDRINSYYGEGLKYYLHEKRMPEAQIFGHSLLCFGHWLAENNDAVERHYKQVIRHNIDEHTDLFNSGRYFASQIYYFHSKGQDLQPALLNARNFYTMINGYKAKSFPAFEYVLAETLILTGQYDDALIYINEAIKKRNNPIVPNIDVRLFESIYLFQAIGLAHVGKTEKAKDIFETISTSNFYFLSRQFNSILYLLLKKHFDKRNFQDKQLLYLVKQTSFTRLISNIPAICKVA